MYTVRRACTISCWVLLCYVPCSYCRASEGEIEGYLSSFDVMQGQNINLYTSTTSPTYDIKIYRLGSTGQRLVKNISDLSGASYSVPDKAWEQGAQWLNPVQLQIPSNWSSGLYKIVLKTASHRSALSFSVREDQPGTKSKILFLDNASTMVAYNNWGGKSLYKFNSSDNVRANMLSLLRPGQNIASRQQREFTAWADSMNVPIEYASIMDLQNSPSLLSNYDTVVLAGHSEYWTKDMRDTFDSFVQNGGNAMILSGNTMWWQIRLEDNQLVGYKSDAKSDPLYGINDNLVTTRWSQEPVNDPENRSIGVSWTAGGYVNSGGHLPASEGYGGYTVTDEKHWIYAGTTLKNGDVLGQEDTIVGFEADGALFAWVDGIPIVTGEDGTPLDFNILGYSPTESSRGSGYATMGIFKSPGGGYVFNAATIDWADGLWDSNNAVIADQDVSTITYNVLQRFSASVVPVPPAFYLFTSGLAVVAQLTKKRRSI